MEKRVTILTSQQRKIVFIRGLHNLQRSQDRSVVTIGSFDGVHLGHQAILKQVKAKAKELNLPSVVMIFEPQPQEFFSGEKAPARLMRVREKVETLRDFGIDKVVCLQFNSALRNLNASEFVHRILIEGLATRFLIVGDDFRFGCDRSGDFNMLRSSGDQYDFEVQDTETLEVNGERISSTLVRTILCQSDFIGAEALLGRPLSLIHI